MSKCVELTDVEVNILVACVQAAAEEGFYTFQNYEVGEATSADIVTLLRKLDVDTADGDWEMIL